MHGDEVSILAWPSANSTPHVSEGRWRGKQSSLHHHYLDVKGARPAVGSERVKMGNLGELVVLHFHVVNIVDRDFNWDFG
jgi:hypothetical protein